MVALAGTCRSRTSSVIAMAKMPSLSAASRSTLRPPSRSSVWRRCAARYQKSLTPSVLHRQRSEAAEAASSPLLLAPIDDVDQLPGVLVQFDLDLVVLYGERAGWSQRARVCLLIAGQVEFQRRQVEVLRIAVTAHLAHGDGARGQDADLASSRRLEDARVAD